MPAYPPRGLGFWDDDLKAYIDINAAILLAAAQQAQQAAATAQAAAQLAVNISGIEVSDDLMAAATSNTNSDFYAALAAAIAVRAGMEIGDDASPAGVATNAQIMTALAGHVSGNLMVFHDGNANMARPITGASVSWAGWVYPNNLASGDVWYRVNVDNFDPLGITTWHNALWAQQIALTDGANISALSDHHGGSVTWSTPATKEPTLVLSSDLAGRPAISFNGVDDYLVTPTFADVVQPFTVCMVVSSTKQPGITARLMGGVRTGGGAAGPSIRRNTSYAYTPTVISSAPMASANTPDQAIIVAYYNGTTASSVRVNGVQVTGSVGDVFGVRKLYLGVSDTLASFANMRLGFFGLKAGALTPTELQEFEVTASAHYGITL